MRTMTVSLIGSLVRSVSLCLPVLAATAVLAVSEPSLVSGEKKNYAYSWQEEVKLGAEADRELVQELGVYENPQLQAYVQAVGERVLAHSNFASPNAPEIYRGTKFTFRVIDSPVVNAFALPGGYVYVTRGLLSHLQNEAQLAVVLGHEVAHVAARHSSQQARRAKWGQIGAIVGAILGEKVLGERVPEVGSAILNAGGKALGMFMLKYSREAEHESDQLGVGYAALAGYAAGQSVPFFQTLQAMSVSEGRALPAWQSTHPDPGDRARRVTEIAANAAKDANNIGEEQYLRQIENLVVGEDPRAGFAQGGVFYHPTLRFQMPVAAGWKLENQRAAVVLAEPNGRAMMGLRIANGARARDAATQFAQQNKVRVTATSDTQVNGLPAHVVIGEATSEEGAVAFWNAFLEMDGKVYSLLGYSEPKDFDEMRRTFESVTGGFSPLRVAEVANVQPARLKLVRANRSGSLASFIPTALPQDLSADAVANMNQLKLNEPVPEGRTLKVPDAPARPNFTPASVPSAPDYRAPAGQPNYPPTGYPPQTGYPSQSYPPQSQPGYPSSQPGYPQPYPPSGQPQPSTGYPPSNYPPAYPDARYPTSQPGGTTYPPQSYPPQSYPPSQQGYPPSGSSYPQSYPNQSPQWPQTPGASQPQQSQPYPPTQQPQSGPAWPRVR